MKISFTRILNSKLPEPYTGLKTDILYFTDRGYIYQEGSSEPIGLCDPDMIKYLTDNKPTEINPDEQQIFDEQVDKDTVVNAIDLNKELLVYIKTTRYASVKHCSTQINKSREDTKKKLGTLERMKILGRYGSFYIINPEIKELLEGFGI